MCTVLLPPGVNPIAVNKYININISNNRASQGKRGTKGDRVQGFDPRSVRVRNVMHKVAKGAVSLRVTRSLLDDIKTKQLQWYGNVQRMEEGRLPKEVMKWRPPGRRKQSRLKLTWAEGIRGLMGEKGLMEEDWNDRGNWRKKIL